VNHRLLLSNSKIVGAFPDFSILTWEDLRPLFAAFVGFRMIRIATRLDIGRSQVLLRLSRDCPGFEAVREVVAVLRVTRGAVGIRYRGGFEIEVTLDGKNWIELSLDLVKLDNRSAIDVLQYWIRFGSRPDESAFDRSLTFSSVAGQRTLTTGEGVTMFLSSIEPWCFVETYCLKIHDIGDNLTGKLVVDVGANAGDTALFYAAKGAVVHAIEPINQNYRALLSNLTVNPDLARSISAHRLAIGREGQTTFSTTGVIDGSASSNYVAGALRESVQSKSLSRFLSDEGLGHVDLLKMDAKGSEFLLTREDLDRVGTAIIEYTTVEGTSLQSLLNVITSAGFEWRIWNHSPFSLDVRHHGTVVARRRTKQL
jgi:FkbM family methyltransferase